MKKLVVTTLTALIVLGLLFWYGFQYIPNWLKLLASLAAVSILVNLAVRIALFMGNPQRAAGASTAGRLGNAIGTARLKTYRENNGWWFILAVMFVLALFGAGNAFLNRPLVTEINEKYELSRRTSPITQKWSNWFSNNGFKSDSQLPQSLAQEMRHEEYQAIKRNWYDWPWGWTAFWLGILLVPMTFIALSDEGAAALKRIAQRMQQRLHSGDVSLGNHWWDQIAHRWISSYATPVAATAGTTTAAGGASASATVHNVGQGVARGFVTSLIADIFGELIGGSIEKGIK